MKKLDYSIVFVSDMGRSVAFYRDVLGLPLRSESPFWSEFATEGCTLALHPAEGKAAAATAEGIRPPAGRCHLGFVVPDLNEFHGRMSAAAVTCLRPPKLEDFGAKMALYADPDGLPLSVVEEKKA